MLFRVFAWYGEAGQVYRVVVQAHTIEDCSYKYVKYDDIPVITVQRFRTTHEEAYVSVITPISRGRCVMPNS